MRRKNRYKKRTSKQKSSQLIKKMKYWLWYEKKISEKLMIKNSEAVRLFFEYHEISFPPLESRADFIISLEKSGKYEVLNNRCIRPRRHDGDKRNYHNYLRSAEWQEKRQELFLLRGRKCERCKKDLNGKMADVHHKTYKNLFNEKMEDLEVLCRPCHKEEHKGKRLNDVEKKIRKKSPVKKKTLTFGQKCKMLESKKGRDKLKSMGYNFIKKSA